MKRRAILGLQFGFLTVTGEADDRHRQRVAVVRCVCGATKEVYFCHLRRGATRSCGCMKGPVITAKRSSHGYTIGGRRPAEYRIWKGIRRRCVSGSVPNFANYGGRGITVCDRWHESFENFLADMGPRPSSAHSIDRIDNNGNYEPANCRWATPREQASNTRTNVLLTARGETLTAAEWSRRTGLAAATILRRVRRGWSHERATSAAPARVGFALRTDHPPTQA